MAVSQIWAKGVAGARKAALRSSPASIHRRALARPCTRRWRSHPQLGERALNQWVDEWWPRVVNLAPSSRERLRGLLDHVLPRFGKVPIATMTQTGVATWVADLQRAGLAPATVHKCHQVLSRVLAAAVRAGLLQRDVAGDVELPRIRFAELAGLHRHSVDVAAVCTWRRPASR